MTLFEKIEQKGLKERDDILKSAQVEADAILSEAKASAEAEAKRIIKAAELQSKRELEQKRHAFDLEKRQAILFEQSSQIDVVIDKLRQHLLSLEGDALLNYSVGLIKKETLSGQTLRVSKKDYDKYLKAFSTEKKADVVTLDKLNKALGKDYNLKLEKTPANITDGFLVLGETYDLNFSIEPFLKTLKQQYERQIFEILF